LQPFILILIFVLSLGAGSILVFRPALAIEVQKRFYALINWRIDPISMEKELRNTRIMGFLLIAIALFALIYLFLKYAHLLVYPAISAI